MNSLGPRVTLLCRRPEVMWLDVTGQTFRSDAGLVAPKESANRGSGSTSCGGLAGDPISGHWVRD